MGTMAPALRTSSRLSSIVWILAAIVAGPLSVLLLGLGEHPQERTMGLLLGAAALLAAATAFLGLVRASAVLARWAVLLAIVWVVGAAAAGTAGYMTGSDLVFFILLPTALPVLAGLSAIPAARGDAAAGGTEAVESGE